MKINLALVKYVSDKKRDVISVKDIRKLNPKTVNDFDAKKSYDVECTVVRRSDSDLDDEYSKQPFPAKILLLAANDDSLVAQAKRKKEKLPPGYAERVNREKREREKGNEEHHKTAKETRKVVRQSDQERMKSIIQSNIKIVENASVATMTTSSEAKKEMDITAQVEPIVNIMTKENTKSPPVIATPVGKGMPISEVSPLIPKQDNVANNFTPTVKMGSQDQMSTPPSDGSNKLLSPGKGTPICDNVPNSFHVSPTVKMGSQDQMSAPLSDGSNKLLSPGKGAPICDNEHGNNFLTPTVKIGSQDQMFVLPSNGFIKIPSPVSLPLSRKLFPNEKVEKKKNEESDSDTSVSCSYQSSEGKLKDLETEVVSLRLKVQSLKKKNSMLCKSLRSHLDHLHKDSEELRTILSLHGDQAVYKATTTWVVEPSPKKQKKKVSISNPSTPIKLSSVCSPKSSAVKKSPLRLTLTGNSTSSPQRKPNYKSPLKSAVDNINGNSEKKKNKSPKKNMKYDNALKPGEVKAEVLCQDLLKVLKKERDIQMNEEKSKVCIGNNTWIKKGVWKDKFSKSVPNMKKLINDLAIEVWGLNGCANISLTGGTSPKNPLAPKKPPAPAGKVEAIFGLCRAQLMYQGMTNVDHLEQTIHQCKNHLRSKLNEAARTVRRAANSKPKEEQD